MLKKIDKLNFTLDYLEKNGWKIHRNKVFTKNGTLKKRGWNIEIAETTFTIEDNANINKLTSSTYSASKNKINLYITMDYEFQVPFFSFLYEIDEPVYCVTEERYIWADLKTTKQIEKILKTCVDKINEVKLQMKERMVRAKKENLLEDF